MALRLRRVAGVTALLFASLLGLAIWVMLVVFATRPGFKAVFDLSPQQRFTVTADTIELLKALRAEGKTVELHTVYEPLRLPEEPTERDRHIYALRLSIQDLTTDLLRQYAAHGGDTVQVRHHSLRDDIAAVRELTRALDRQMQNFALVKVGARSRVLSIDFDLAEIDMGQNQGPQMPGQARDAKPLLENYKGEEAITSAIRGLLAEGEPKLYVLEGYREANIKDAISMSYSSMMHELEQEGFKVARLNLAETKRVPADAACVALLEPRSEMDDAHAEALVAYLRAEGRLFVNVVYTQDPATWNPRLENLGNRLGFKLSEDVVCHLVPDPQQPNRPGRDGDPYVQNILATLNPVHPVTAPLSRAGRLPILKLAREIGLAADRPDYAAVDLSLLSTGPYAWLEERTVASGGGGDPQIDYYAPRDARAFGRRCVGAVIDVRPAVETARPGHLVLLSGHAFNNLGFAQHGDLALNIFQWMAERKALVGVRGTRYQPRELKLVGQQVGRVQWLLVAGVPALLLVLGLGVLWRRSRI